MQMWRPFVWYEQNYCKSDQILGALVPNVKLIVNLLKAIAHKMSFSRIKSPFFPHQL